MKCAAFLIAALVWPLLLPADDADEVLQALTDNNENAWRLGVIQQAADRLAAPAVLWANESFLKQ